MTQLAYFTNIPNNGKIMRAGKNCLIALIVLVNLS